MAKRLPAVTSENTDSAYRGYLIRRNPLNGMLWIEKDGQKIAYVTSEQNARETIDLLVS